jgi:hypothetical protein
MAYHAVRLLLALAMIALALLSLVAWWWAVSHPLQTDFVDAYIQSRTIWQYGAGHAYDVAALEHVRSAYHPQVWYRYLFSPAYALVSMPVGLLPLGLAALVWGLCLMAAVVAGWMLITPGGLAHPRWSWLVLALAWPFTLHSFRWQAVDLIVAALYIAAWRASQSRHPVLSGLLLAVCVIKPQMVWLCAPALIGARSWRIVGAGVIGVVLVSLCCLAVFGPESLTTWLGNVEASLQNPLQQTVTPVSGVATLLPRPAAIVFGLLVAGLCFWIGRRSAGAPAAVFAAGALASPIASSYIHPSSMVMLICALGLLHGHTDWPHGRRFAVAFFPLAMLGIGTPAGILALIALLVLAFGRPPASVEAHASAAGRSGPPAPSPAPAPPRLRGSPQTTQRDPTPNPTRPGT